MLEYWLLLKENTTHKNVHLYNFILFYLDFFAKYANVCFNIYVGCNTDFFFVLAVYMGYDIVIISMF